MKGSGKKTGDKNRKKIFFREQQKENPKFTNNNLYFDAQKDNLCKISSLMKGNPEH